MRRHPKPSVSPAIFVVVQRLKVLRLLMNASLTPPPPGLVHKRSMRRIHQPDNPMIDIAWQLRHQVRTAKLSRKLWHLRHRRQRFTHSPSPRSRQIHPRKPIPLLARKSTRINLRRVERLMARQRRNLPALSAARLKPPPVILARHRLPIEPPSRKRDPSMRTKISHRKQLPTRLPPQQQRNPQQQRLRRLALSQLPSTQRRVPIPKDQLRRRPRNLHQITQPKHPRSNNTLIIIALRPKRLLVTFGPAGRAHCAWSGHFVTGVSLRSAAPAGRDEISLCRPSGGSRRSRYISHEVTAARAGRFHGS